MILCAGFGKRLHPLTFSSPPMKECLSRLTFRDVLLAAESKGRQGARTFQALPGLTRDRVALEIINQFGANRVSTFHSPLRENQVSKLSQAEIEEENLLLTVPLHTVFGRNQTPVSFILDVDAQHESPEETAEPSRVTVPRTVPELLVGTTSRSETSKTGKSPFGDEEKS